MGRHAEVERKFLVAALPRGWDRQPHAQIAQGYLPTGNLKKSLEIRLRRKDSEYFLTIKQGQGGKRFEEEIAIPEPSFRALWPLTVGQRIFKTRYRIPVADKTAELDVYGRSHRGLRTVEVEFGSDRESRAFQPPAWFGR